MHNWKWVNLSKMAGFNTSLSFNISLSLNERQSSCDKKHNKSLRLVLFFPFRCCFAGSLPFSLSTVKQTKLFHSISEVFFTFLAKRTLWVKLECVRSGAASCNNRREFWRETHTPLWLLIGRIIFFTCENHRSLLWLARINLRTKIYGVCLNVAGRDSRVEVAGAGAGKVRGCG